MREIVYNIWVVAPYIKPQDKPTKKQIMKLSIDEVPVKEEALQEDVIKEAEAFEDKLKFNN